MTDALTFSSTNDLYTHPNIRSLTAEQLHFRLTATRQRRLITAIDFQTAQTKRLDKEGNKLSDQWAKLRDRISTDIVKATELLEKSEAGITKLNQLSNQIAILE